MLFNEIVGNLLALPNCSLIVKSDWGDNYFQNLHKTVRLYSQSVCALEDRSKGSPSYLMKKELNYILTNYKTLDKYKVGYKPKR